MRRRRRTVLLVVGIVANLVGIAALALPWLSMTVVADTTTTMMWIDGHEGPWVPWAWVALSIAGLATVVVASRGSGDGVDG